MCSLHVSAILLIKRSSLFYFKIVAWSSLGVEDDVACKQYTIHTSRNSYRKGRVSTVDLLLLESLDQLLLTMQILSIFLTKQATVMRRSTVLSRPFQQVFRAQMHALLDQFHTSPKMQHHLPLHERSLV